MIKHLIPLSLLFLIACGNKEENKKTDTAHMQTEHFKTYGAQMQECGELKIEKLNF